MRLLALVSRVHEDGALAEEVAVLFQQQVAHSEHEGVAGMEHGGEGKPRLVERADGFFREAHALVALQHGGEFAAVAPGDAAIALADGGRDVGDLEAGGLSRIHRTAQRRKGFHEESADEVGLEAAGLGFFHLLLHCEEALGAHAFLGQGVAVEDGAQVVVVEGVLDALAEPGADVRLVAVADGLEQQVLEAGALEDFAKDVEDAAIERLALDPKFFQQPEIDLAFASFLGDKVPEVTNLLLVDTVDAAEALLDRN